MIDAIFAVAWAALAILHFITTGDTEIAHGLLLLVAAMAHWRIYLRDR